MQKEEALKQCVKALELALSHNRWIRHEHGHYEFEAEPIELALEAAREALGQEHGIEKDN